jgi:hypothetical protein
MSLSKHEPPRLTLRQAQGDIAIYGSPFDKVGIRHRDLRLAVRRAQGVIVGFGEIREG